MVNHEPTENLSGDTPVAPPDSFGDEPPQTVAEAVIDRLGELYWRKHYGDRPGFECLIRTVLSQHTSDKASQPAFEALLDRYDGDEGLASSLANADRAELADVISSAGLYNQKSRVIQHLAEEVVQTWGGVDEFDTFVQVGERSEVRSYLLSLDGVGPKTADCVMLFAGGEQGVFPVDTHVYRIARRIGIAPPAADYESVRRHLEDAVPPKKCGFGHTSMIQFGREYCTATNPSCLAGLDACPMADLCDRVGVDVSSKTVTDPADAVES